MNDEGPKKVDETAAIREGIERTRGEMSATVNKIEERLSPAHIEEQVAELKQSVLGSYHEAKDHLKDDISRELHDAKEKVKEEFSEVKDKVQHEISDARTAVRDATVGRVENMVHEARHMVHDAGETVTEAGGTVLDTIKANPIPTALVALGVGWLIMSARKSSSQRVVPSRLYLGEYDDESPVYGRSYGGQDLRGPRRMMREGQRAVGTAIHSAEDRAMHAGRRMQQGANHLVHQAGDVAHDVGERVGAVAHDVGERVQHMTHEVGHYAEEAGIRGRRVARRAGRQVMRVERGFENTIKENPLAIGAVALAVGAAIGLSLPSTQTEDEWMGATKERLVDRAEDFAGEALHKVESTVVHQLEGSSTSEGIAQVEPVENTSSEPKNGLSNGISKSDKRKTSTI